MNPSSKYPQNAEAEQEEAARHSALPEARRQRWPDDGLPPNLASGRAHRTLHPYGVIGSILGKS